MNLRWSGTTVGEAWGVGEMVNGARGAAVDSAACACAVDVAAPGPGPAHPAADAIIRLAINIL